MKNRVLIINDHIHFGGGGDAVLHLEKSRLESLGYKVSTVSFGEKSEVYETNYIIGAPLKIRYEKFVKFGSSQKIEKELSNIIRRISPDLIHIHLLSKFPLAVYNCSELNNVPVIQTLHGPNLFCSTSWGGLKNSGPCELGIGGKCYARGCTGILSTLLYTQLQKRYWKSLHTKINVFHCPSINIFNSAKRLGFDNTVYIPLGIDEMFLKEPEKIDSNRPTLLYAGALAEQKGIQYLLPALKKVKETFSNILLRIAGRGHMLDYLSRTTKELGLENNVEFCGFISRDKIRDFYLSGNIFLIPSIWQEQFGLVGPEALACKVPCIGTNVGGIPEWLHHGENGLLIPPQDSDSLSNAIIQLLSQPEQLEEMGRRGREFAIRVHHPDKYITSLTTLINKTLNE